MWIQRAQTLGLQVNASLKKPLLLAVEDYAGVDELSALNAGYHAQESVFEGTSHAARRLSFLARAPTPEALATA